MHIVGEPSVHRVPGVPVRCDPEAIRWNLRYQARSFRADHADRETDTSQREGVTHRSRWRGGSEPSAGSLHRPAKNFRLRPPSFVFKCLRLTMGRDDDDRQLVRPRAQCGAEEHRPLDRTDDDRGPKIEKTTHFHDNSLRW